MAAGSIDEWGPPLWKFLHTASFAYPDAPSAERQQAMLEFLQAVGRVLPCAKCRTHYGSHCKTCLLPDVVQSRDSLTHWLVDLHNEVNRRTGKPEWTYEQASAAYASHRPAARGASPAVAAVVLGVAVACAVALLLVVRRRANPRLAAP